MNGTQIYFIVLIWIFSFSLSLNTRANEAPVRLNGVFEYGDHTFFSLACNRSGATEWVELNQSFHDGSIVDYDRVNRNVRFSDSTGLYIIQLGRMAGDGDGPVDVPSETMSTPYTVVNLKPFRLVPTEVKQMPADSLVEFLSREGYEIPAHISSKATSIASLKQRAEEIKQGVSGDSKDVRLGPRNPSVTTSLTRVQKIAAGRFGYAN